MYAMFTGGVTLWGIYGVMTMQWSIIIANAAVTVVLASIILTMKVREVLASRTINPQDRQVLEHGLRRFLFCIIAPRTSGIAIRN